MFEGFLPRRLAEVIVTDAHGPGRRGSGYRVTTTAVLTAAHVVDAADAVMVRFDAEQPTEWMAIAVTTWCDLVTDLAVLTIDPPDSQSLVPARFGYADDVGVFGLSVSQATVVTHRVNRAARIGVAMLFTQSTSGT